MCLLSLRHASDVKTTSSWVYICCVNDCRQVLVVELHYNGPWI